MPEPALAASGLVKHFGGVVAVDQAGIEIARGEIHAVIGPNGAGKSTLVGLLSGAIRADAGSVRLEGREIAGQPIDRVARLGVGRSFQRSNVFLGFSALENCRLAAQARLASSFHFFRPAAARRTLIDAARVALQQVGLDARAGDHAALLSHGERRQLEIGMTLATRPKVVLLDEPLAGMGAEESQTMVKLIAGLRAEHAILLIEHDMEAIFALADRVTVLVNGRVIACGAPATVRADQQVQRAYLGGPRSIDAAG